MTHFRLSDVGGWNNIRMQMELVLVFAYATGRTLVLPPDQPMYLLNKGKGHQKAHSFADFFPFDYINQRMNVISMEEFMRREAVAGQLRNTTTGKCVSCLYHASCLSHSGNTVIGIQL